MVICEAQIYELRDIKCRSIFETVGLNAVLENWIEGRFGKKKKKKKLRYRKHIVLGIPEMKFTDPVNLNHP